MTTGSVSGVYSMRALFLLSILLSIGCAPVVYAHSDATSWYTVCKNYGNDAVRYPACVLTNHPVLCGFATMSVGVVVLYNASKTFRQWLVGSDDEVVS